MKYDELTVFRAAVALAVACKANERPMPEEAAPEQVARYVNGVLELVFSYSGIDFAVKPLKYPKAAKVPIVIDLAIAGPCLYWYYPYDTNARIADELAGAMENMMSEVIGLPVEGGVA